MSDYNDFAKVGWQGHGGVLAPVGEAGEATVVVGAEGYFGSNNHDTDGDKTNLYGGLALVGIQFGDPEEVSPGIYAGLGSMTHSFKSDLTPAFEGSNTSLAAGGGAGVSFPLGSIRGFVGGNFVTGFSDNSGTKYIGFGFSAVIPVGGNGMWSCGPTARRPGGNRGEVLRGPPLFLSSALGDRLTKRMRGG